MNFFCCVSWEGNFENLFNEFPCLRFKRMSGCCRLIPNLSEPKKDVLIHYENNLEEVLRTLVKRKEGNGDIGIDIFGTETGTRDFTTTRYSKFGKISVAVNGFAANEFFENIQKVKNEILQEGKLLFSEGISELILNILTKKSKVLDGIKSIPNYLGGEYNFAVLGKWGIYLRGTAGMIVAARKDGGAFAGTNFTQMLHCGDSTMDILKQDTILHLQNGSFRAVP